MLNSPPLYIPYKDIIIVQREDYYINSSPVLRLFNKTYASWIKTKDYSSYIEALSSLIGITSLSIPSSEGLWIHPCLFTKLAKWLSPAFEVFIETSILYPFNNINSVYTLNSISQVNILMDSLNEDIRLSVKDKVRYKLKAIEKVYPHLTRAIEYLEKEFSSNLT
jgi:hypothetical protein